MSLLSVRGVDKTFGGLHAVSSVSLELRERGIFGLIGPNGAGKTTLFNLITGVYRPDAGQVRFAERDITGLQPAQIAALGIARTFQNIRLFRAMTVEQNVMVAGHHVHRASVLSAMFRTRRHAEDESALRSRALELLELFNLRDCASDIAGSLPYGSQRRLEIARALMLGPKLLLLDEPAAGMNSQEAEGLKRQVRFLRDELGISLLLVEHNMSVVMGVCDVVHVLDQGRTIAEGEPLSVQNNPRVIAAYLGRDTEPPPASGAAAPENAP
ncbi:MAG TPA: ABC transporter ATP-binding protein [Polyangiaceae bacterium]|nr:ABC transporter ATP-binding protein [Polyangiaceae bacterium]